MSPTYPYLGTPTSMQQFPGPNGTIVRTPSKGESLKQLASGATARIVRLQSKNVWTLPYVSRPGSGTADLIESFYDGIYGLGPFVFVDPSVRNVLPLDASTFGVRAGSSHGWVASSGTVTTGAPATIDPTVSNKLTWAGASANATLMPGLTTTTASTSSSPVGLPNEPTTVSLSILSSSAVTATLQVVGLDSTGTVSGTPVGVSVALTTTWTRFSVTAAALSVPSTSAYVLPRLVLGATAPSSVWLSQPQLEYASTVSAWQRGHRSPRVQLTDPPSFTQNKYDDYVDCTLTLAEV